MSLRPPSNITEHVARPVSDYIMEVYASIVALDSQLATLNSRVTRLPTAPSEIPATPSLVAAILGLSGSPPIQDTFANLVNYPAGNYPLGQLYWVTDRTVFYEAVLISSIRTWRYVAGMMLDTFAGRPAGLAVNDTGFLFYATDQSTVYIWTGAAYDTITRRILIGGFFAILTHANTADRTYTLPNETGDLVYKTVAALTASRILLGDGTAKAKILGSLGATTTVLHGNAAGDPSFAAVSLTADVTGVLPIANGGSLSGTYTPTRSAETNLDSNVTFTAAQYLRAGNIVTVSGRFTANPTLAATATSFEGTLPIASNIGAASDASGVAFCGSIAGQGAEIIGVAANDTFKVQWVSGDITSQTWSYTFTYQVI